MKEAQAKTQYKGDLPENESEMLKTNSWTKIRSKIVDIKNMTTQSGGKREPIDTGREEVSATFSE